MQRHIRQPRSDWREQVERVGLTYHSHDNGPYWDESACYELTRAEVETLEQAANELHRLSIHAAGAVVENGWWWRLGIPEVAVPAILRSWQRDDFSLYGRFDLAYDGVTPPKLLEYNADTPTALVEAAVAQWFWLQDTHADADQFNSIHERLIEAWRRFAMMQTERSLQAAAAQQCHEPLTLTLSPSDGEREKLRLSSAASVLGEQSPTHEILSLYPSDGERAGVRGISKSFIHFGSIKEHPEDEMTVLYLRDTCEQAGVANKSVFIEDIGWDAKRECFVDLDNLRIEHCFKLYPWEWLWHEEFGAHLAEEPVHFIEPTWKMLLSNKGLLPILWELFPGHPNLLPAYETAEPLGGRYVRKPKLSREGSNVSLVEGGVAVEETVGDYGEEGHVYQALAPLPEFSGQHPVCGVWVVDHEAAGLGIREDTRRITGNLSRFVPHFFHHP